MSSIKIQIWSMKSEEFKNNNKKSCRTKKVVELKIMNIQQNILKINLVFFHTWNLSFVLDKIFQPMIPSCQRVFKLFTNSVDPFFFKFFSPNLKFFSLKCFKTLISIQTFHQTVSHFLNLSTPNLRWIKFNCFSNVQVSPFSYQTIPFQWLSSSKLHVLWESVKAYVMNLTLVCVPSWSFAILW